MALQYLSIFFIRRNFLVFMSVALNTDAKFFVVD